MQQTGNTGKNVMSVGPGLQKGVPKRPLSPSKQLAISSEPATAGFNIEQKKKFYKMFYIVIEAEMEAEERDHGKPVITSKNAEQLFTLFQAWMPMPGFANVKTWNNTVKEALKDDTVDPSKGEIMIRLGSFVADWIQQNIEREGSTADGHGITNAEQQKSKDETSDNDELDSSLAEEKRG